MRHGDDRGGAAFPFGKATMDGDRFDAMTRRLATRQTRRGVMRGAIAGVAALTGIRAGAAGQAACPAGQYHDGTRCLCQNTGAPPNRKTGECRCGSGTTDCGGVCVDLDRDPNHCGACGRPCVGGECRKGECRCAGGGTDCGGVCVDFASDLVNCGACGVACPVTPGVCQGEAVCQGGGCGYLSLGVGTPCDDGNGCTQNTACDDKGQCAGGTLVGCTALDECHDVGLCDPATGACSTPNRLDGTACGGEIGGQTCCGGVCCAVGEECVGGSCRPDCLAVGNACSDETDCCQNEETFCDGTCCHGLEGSCAADGECCSGRCNGEFCCAGPRQECTGEGDCCGGALGSCDQGFCRCAEIGTVCGTSFECCDGLSCSDGTCQPGTCLGLQEQCTNDFQCCESRADCAQSCGVDPFCCLGNGAGCSADCDCCGGQGTCEGGACCQSAGGACNSSLANTGCCSGLTCTGVNGTCELVCAAGTRLCGIGCCPFGQECCNGVCCATNQDCRNLVCQACLPLRSDCDPANNICCQDAPTVCLVRGAEAGLNSEVCCRPVGGACTRANDDTGNSDCCSNTYDPPNGPCGFDGICGGEGAACGSDRRCVSGRCRGRCNNQFPVRPCSFSEECDCEGDFEDGCVEEFGFCIDIRCQ